MGHFDDETAIEQVGRADWTTTIEPMWRIGDNANGGYALTPVLRAMRSLGAHQDPISVTTHFLRPVHAVGDAQVHAELIRRGRSTTVARGTLTNDGRERLTAVAAFGDLTDRQNERDFWPKAPEIPPPIRCVRRAELSQAVELPILERLDVRIHPDRAIAGGSPDAIIEGWIRFADESEPTSLALALFADAFPPSLYCRLGSIGWVPTIELTVHVRRRPSPGWIQARFECDDLSDGRMIESGALWDSDGALVARSRQLGLLLAS